jgi:signal transduction histidine kinase
VTELQAANTELVRANDDLARAGQLKTAFIEVASHEFNTPITLLLGLTELLRLCNPTRSQQEQEILCQMIASSRQLARLVTNMLTLLRAEDFRKTLELHPVDLADLMHRVADQVRLFTRARNITLETTLADDLGAFDIDADKISAVLINLLTNAVKFTRDGGAIELMARLSDADQAEIIVHDRGVGLDPRELGHLFQPFFTQLDPSRHSSGDFGYCKRGLGLGLSIAKQFVEMHGGRITAHSREGEGTQVIVRLPRHARPVTGSAVEAVAIPPPSTN